MRGRLQEQLPSMFALAHQRSEGARVQLAGMLADVFLSDGNELSAREEELVNDLIDQLLSTRNPAVRAELMNKFADTSRMPRRIAVTLATDHIDVARTVLATSQTLNDGDLITVVATCTREHAKAVAQRQSISEAVADALITTGDVQVMQVVAENLGAKLTSKAVTVLTEAARFCMELHAPVMQRPEMTGTDAARLYWWVPQDLRRYALKRFSIPAGQIDESLAKTIEDLLAHYGLERDDPKAMQQVADWLEERQAVSPRILPQVLRMGHFRLFGILIARMVKLRTDLAEIMIAETGGRPLAVACRALGIDKSGFVSIFLLSRGARPGEQVVHPRELSHALAAFDRLTANLAQDLLKSWQEDPSYLLRRKGDLVLEEAV